MCIIPFISLVGITNHVVTTISAFSFIMLLLDRILTLIVNRISNTSYHLQYLYYPGGNETGAKPNLITCITEIFLSVPGLACLIAQSRKNLWDIEFQKSWTMNSKKFMDHEFRKNHGPWISKNCGTLIFKNFWTVIFFFFEKFEIFKNLRNYVLI